MRTRSSILALVTLIILTAPTLGQTKNPEKKKLALEWLDFLSGKWDTEFRVARDGEWGEARNDQVELKLVAGKQAVTGSNDQWVVTTGWDPGKQALVTFVIGANDWVIRCEMPEITKKELSGTLNMTLPDGTVRKTTRKWKRVDDDTIHRSALGDANGVKFEEKSVWKRVK